MNSWKRINAYFSRRKINESSIKKVQVSTNPYTLAPTLCPIWDFCQPSPWQTTHLFIRIPWHKVSTEYEVSTFGIYVLSKNSSNSAPFPDYPTFSSSTWMKNNLLHSSYTLKITYQPSHKDMFSSLTPPTKSKGIVDCFSAPSLESCLFTLLVIPGKFWKIINTRLLNCLLLQLPVYEL